MMLSFIYLLKQIIDLTILHLCFFRLIALIGGPSRCHKVMNALAIQVRLFSPTMFGIAKGVLMVKDDIDKIQIPASMIKVNKSNSKEPLHDSVIMIVSGIYPSDNAITIGKIYHPSLTPPESGLNNLSPLRSMFCNVMLARGVRGETLDGCECCQCEIDVLCSLSWYAYLPYLIR